MYEANVIIPAGIIRNPAQRDISHIQLRTYDDTVGLPLLLSRITGERKNLINLVPSFPALPLITSPDEIREISVAVVYLLRASSLAAEVL